MVIIDRKISSVYIAVVMSAILYALGFTSFLLVLPLLIYYSRSREREKTLLSLAVLLVFVLMMEIFPLIGTLSDKGNLGILSIGLFLPVVLIGSSMVWVLLDGYRLLTRYVASSAIVALIMVIIGFWFKSDAEMSLAVDNAIVSAMNSILGQDSQQTSYILGVSSQELFITMRTVVFSMLLPLGAG
jgi:small-conductance mechanosensitive channel